MTRGVALWRKLALATALAVSASTPSRAEKLDRSHLALTFSEEFDAPLQLYSSARRDGRWKTNYDFARQGDASSRTLDGEYQTYVDAAYIGVDPFTVHDGQLTITASPNTRRGDPKTAGKPYLSGLLTTVKSFSQRFGYFEVRAKLPVSPGAWPAFWLALPLDAREPGAKYGDEIDVFEFLGNDPGTIVCTVHWPDGLEKTKYSHHAVPTVSPDRFHTYGVLWSPTSIVWYVDDDEVARDPNPGLVKPMNLLLNLAVGGWGGNRPASPPTPMRFVIDYVRAYSLGGA